MSDLRDAFKKAGLIDDKTDRRLKHEERVQKKELGREGLDQRQQQENDERRKRDDEKKLATKTAQQKHDQERQRSERWKKLLAELSEQAVRTSGPRRFHYRDADGFLPYLQVDDETGRRLEAGELAIVKLPAHDETALCARELAVELHALAPERVVHLLR